MNQELLAVIYLLSGLLFIFGLRGLTHPASARRGNLFAISGMLIAVISLMLDSAVHNHGMILSAILIGAVIGVTLATRVQMTSMPELVAGMHSFVGLAAVLVAIGTFFNRSAAGTLNSVLMVELAVGTFIGAITFTGSLVAFGKLCGRLSGNPVVFKGQHLLNLILALVMIALTWKFWSDHSVSTLLLLTVVALVLGVLIIIPIGGADMPVVVSMLNSYSGWAAAATGFTLANNLLIITGSLVGFSGAILSYIMCRAMNRGFFSVILGGFGGDAEASGIASAAQQKGVKSAAVEDATFMMENASKIIIVPGYGMAVAQAQHAVKELVHALEEKDIDVKFAIHPVAGRMPGHMNVLLAEADIPYDNVFEMEEINPEFNTADVALVIGANDITNPAAKTDRASPIYGMPILEVSKTRQVFVIKRSMNPGYAGVDNLLYYMDNCSMVFGDAKAVCDGLAKELRGAGH